MNEIRWGVLSTGRIAHKFAQDMAHVQHSSIRGVTNRTPATALEFASRYDIGVVYDDYESMLADPDIDAIYVATPHSLHCDNTLAAVAAGKPVLCEKPITLNPTELGRIIDAVRASNAYVMEAMWTWFLPAIQRARDWMRAGRIGSITQIRADFGFRTHYDPDSRVFNKSLGGGALLDVGIYPVALLWFFLRRAPDTIHVASRHAPNGVDDDLTAVFDYTDCIGTIACSFRAKMPNVAFVIGEEGYLAIPDFWRARECRLYVNDECIEVFKDDRESIGLCFETQAVVDDLRAGRTQSEIVTLNDSLNFQQTMQHIRAQFTPGTRRTCQSPSDDG